jgi:hypothetical protein
MTSFGGVMEKIIFRILQEGLKYGDRILPSGYFESQTWGALHKCWVGFVIAKEKMEWDKIDLYAKRIQNLESNYYKKIHIIIFFILI